jgi:hypothetical protein
MFSETAGPQAYSRLASDGGDGCRGVRTSPLIWREPSGLLPHETAITGEPASPFSCRTSRTVSALRGDKAWSGNSKVRIT